MMLSFPRDPLIPLRYDWTPEAWAKFHVTGKGPGDRSPNHASPCWDPKRKRFVFFGGGPGGYSPAFPDCYVRPADLWAFDLERSVWAPLPCPEPNPGPRKYFDLVYDPANDVYVLVGGQTGGWFHRDVWVYDPSAGRWWEVATETAPPWAGGCSGYMNHFALQYDPVNKQFLGMVGLCCWYAQGLWSLKIGSTARK
jgi:hypothetical protein